MTRVGFVGLGRMGALMAANLGRAGFPLVLWNRSRAKVEQLALETNAEVCDTPRELAEGSDVVITMLADDHASDQVHRGAKRTVIDAPVSGSTDAARDARLMIMVGATEDAIEPVRPILAAMSREVVCLGTTGAGATMKLAINMLIHGLNQTLAESLTLAEAAGIPPADAYRAIEGSAAAAPMLGYRKPNYLDEVATPVSFALSLARKDVALALDLAAELDVPMPQTQLNLDQLKAAEAAGFGERDMASIVNYLRGIT